jgi:large subunit ribosomal protein L10
MNREQKTAVVAEVAAQIQASEAVFAVDYRGISVPQAAALRERLNEAGARFRVVKNTLTLRAADKAGADSLKEVLEGPTAFTFVPPEEGDVALAAKALAQFSREHNLLEFKGGVMNGDPLTAEQIAAIAQLPAKDLLYGQVVGMIASPITGLVRGLNALIAGLAIQLKQIADEGMVPRGEAQAAAAEAPGEADPAEADQAAQSEQAEEEAARSAEDEETESSSEESAPAGGEEADAAGEETEHTEAPTEGEDTDTPSEGENE